MLHEENSSGRYVRAVRELRARGHGTTWAHEVIRSGLLPTFLIGRGRFALVADIDALPKLLQDPANQQKLKAASYDANRVDRRTRIAA